MTEWNKLDRETGRGFGYAVKWIVAALAVIAGLAIAWVTWVSPVLIDADTDNKRESHQYVETQRTFLMQKLDACRELEAKIAEEPDSEANPARESQVKAYVKEMRRRAALIDDNEVPAEVRDYLREKSQ